MNRTSLRLVMHVVNVITNTVKSIVIQTEKRNANGIANDERKIPNVKKN